MFISVLSDLQLSVQSVPITTNTGSSNPTQTRSTRYNIMWLSLSVTCSRLVVISGYFGFLHQWNWLTGYNWNITSIKHNNSNPELSVIVDPIIRGGGGIPLIGLPPPHCCACTTYVVFFLCSMVCVERYLFICSIWY